MSVWNVGLCTGVGGSGGVGGSVGVDGTSGVDSGGSVGGGCGDSDSQGVLVEADCMGVVSESSSGGFVVVVVKDPIGKKTSTRCLIKTSKTSCQDIFQMSKRCLKRKSGRDLRKTS